MINIHSLRHRGRTVRHAALVVLVTAIPAVAGAQITSPRQALGFDIGDDYHLATYAQLAEYWQTLAGESQRLVVEQIGTTAEGRPQLMAIITSPENHQNLDRYKQIARRMALAEGLDDEQAHTLAKEGRAVVWIDGGLHATEVLGAHQLMELVYQMVSRDDDETKRILDDVILLAVHANPDGMELVSNWYMREPEPEKRSTRGIPRLYQKYIGHDNNRDFFMVTQPETENMTRIMFHEWFPQIVYNHHQTGPSGTVLFAPPFRDPFNYNLDPLIPVGIDMVGAAMHSRFIAKGKPGSTMRGGASYSTWWNGGLRTVTYFHNMIGLLTETIGNPTPIEIPLLPGRQLPSGDLPFPIEPQTWHFRQSIDYSITANRAVLDYASRYRETLLSNIYVMGRNSIERGSRDFWTPRPDRIRIVEEAVRQEQDSSANPRSAARRRGVPIEYFAMLRRPEDRDPRGYVLPADQVDFATATKFVNTLIKNGVAVHRATAPFVVNGTGYPAGSYVIKTAQAFRPHVVDMFEPQNHPNDFEYPGGPPIPPYDNAGWTLAFQMGVAFDRILKGFDGPFERIEGFARVPPGTVAQRDGAAGFLVSHAMNDAAIVTNRVLAAGGKVYWLTAPTDRDGTNYPAGTLYIPAEGLTVDIDELAAELGVSFRGVPAMPGSGAGALEIKPIRVGLWDRYGGSMQSGWTRWLLEEFEFPFELVYAPDLDEGDLSRFDVLVFPAGAIPGGDDGEGFRRFRRTSPDASTIPQEYSGWLGSVTVDKTVPRLLDFVRGGGTIVAIGSSTSIGDHGDLAIANHLVDDAGARLRREEYYVPGSVLRVRVDNTRPVAYGMPDYVDVFFNNSPVFRIVDPNAGLVPVLTFDSDAPLRSGWAWGQERLENGVAMIEATLGEGTLFLIGPEVLNRGQPHGTFKLFFNSLYLAGASPVHAEAAEGR